MELNREQIKKALDWLDSLVGNSDDSDIAMFTYQLLGILYDTCEELTEKNERLRADNIYGLSAKELAEKDLKKARLSLENARVQKNVDNVVIDNLEQKCALREEIFKIVAFHTEVKQNA